MESINLYGQTYLIDTMAMSIIDAREFDNRIYTTELMTEGNRYYIVMDKETKTPASYGKEVDNEKYAKVYFDQFLKIDPTGMRKRFSLSENDPLPDLDCDLRTSKAALERRMLDGKLPIIEILGNNYLVNARKDYIINNRISDTDRTDLVSWHQMVQVTDGLRFVFDRENSRVVAEPQFYWGSSKELYAVEIPLLGDLDPYGNFLKSGMKMEDMNDNWLKAPYQEKTTALTLPLRDMKDIKDRLHDQHLFRDVLLKRKTKMLSKNPPKRKL